MNAYLILPIALVLFVCALWLHGVFEKGKPPRQKWAYALRVALWMASVLIVAWPLALYRREMGEIAYLVLSVGVLVLFFGIGRVVSRLVARGESR